MLQSLWNRNKFMFLLRHIINSSSTVTSFTCTLHCVDYIHYDAVQMYTVHVSLYSVQERMYGAHLHFIIMYIMNTCTVYSVHRTWFRTCVRRVRSFTLPASASPRSASHVWRQLFRWLGIAVLFVGNSCFVLYLSSIFEYKFISSIFQDLRAEAVCSCLFDCPQRILHQELNLLLVPSIEVCYQQYELRLSYPRYSPTHCA